MKKRIHPSHIRSMRIALIVFILLSAIFLGIAFYVANPFDHRLETIFSLLAMIMMAAIVLIGVLSTSISKCPQCRSWIHRRKETVADDDHVNFICKKCDIVWDSGMTGEINT